MQFRVTGVQDFNEHQLLITLTASALDYPIQDGSYMKFLIAKNESDRFRYGNLVQFDWKTLWQPTDAEISAGVLHGHAVDTGQYDPGPGVCGDIVERNTR